MSGCSWTQTIPFSHFHDVGPDAHVSAVGIVEVGWEVQEQQFLAGSGVTVDS